MPFPDYLASPRAPPHRQCRYWLNSELLRISSAGRVASGPCMWVAYHGRNGQKSRGGGRHASSGGIVTVNEWRRSGHVPYDLGVQQPSSLYKRHRFSGEIISHAVWLYRL